MENKLSNLAWQWITDTTTTAKQLDNNYYCSTRDIFQARLDKMALLLLKEAKVAEELIYLLTAIIGEIGNNSFDHNLGNWPNIAGIFFGYHFFERLIILADRGQGILTTLKKVKPTLQTDQQALETAFKEKLSGRAPENRGNGLKFVRESVQAQQLHLTFISGQAQADLNQLMRVKSTERAIKGCLAILTF